MIEMSEMCYFLRLVTRLERTIQEKKFPVHHDIFL